MTSSSSRILHITPLAALFLAALLCQSPRLAHGQIAGGMETSFTYNFFTPGQPTMQVYIWGDVRNAGIWRVNREVDFFELLSAAQPGSIGQERAQRRQRIDIRVYRTRQGERRLVYEERLESMLEEDLPLPELTEEDVLEVRTRERRSRIDQFRLVVGVIGSAASLATLILRIADGR